MDDLASADQIELAPGAGSGIGKALAGLLVSDPEFLPKLKAAFVDALGAETERYDKETRTFVTMPDYRTRLSAAMNLLSHMEGDPIKRVIHQHLHKAGQREAREALADSPALLAQMRREIDKAEVHARRNAHHAKHPAAAGEVTVLEVD